MALVFVPNQVGMAVGIPVEGGQAGCRIQFGVNYQVNKYDLGITAGLRGLGDMIDVAADYWTKPENRLSAEEIAALALVNPAAGAAAAAVRLAMDWKYKSGSAGLNRGPQFNSSLQDAALRGGPNPSQDWTANAHKALNEIIKPMGIITSVTLDFKENASWEGTTVTAGGAMVAGTASIGGVVFDAVCGSTGNRHGLEPILEYYYYHRVSAAGSVGSKGGPKTETALRFGKTVLKGWVVGMHAEPQNMDYRIWRWDLNLLVDPDYNPQPAQAPVMRNGANAPVNQEMMDSYNERARKDTQQAGTKNI